MQMLGLIPRVSDSGGPEWPSECEFLTGSQVKLLLLVEEPHPENHWSRAISLGPGPGSALVLG